MTLDGKSISPMDYVALGTSTHYVAWSHVALGTVSVDHIFPLGSPVYPQNTTKFKKHIEYW